MLYSLNCNLQQILHNPMGMHTGYDNRNFVALVSEESHYSEVMAGNVIGTEPSMALLLGPIVFVVVVTNN